MIKAHRYFTNELHTQVTLSVSLCDIANPHVFVHKIVNALVTSSVTILHRLLAWFLVSYMNSLHTVTSHSTFQLGSLCGSLCIII